MYLDKIEETIATRRLYLLRESNDQKEVLVVIGKPQPSTESLGYYCPFHIIGIGSEKIKYAMGLDAIQALQGALLLIGASLQFLNERFENGLRWEGDEQGDLGFPVMVEGGKPAGSDPAD